MSLRFPRARSCDRPALPADLPPSPSAFSLSGSTMSNQTNLAFDEVPRGDGGTGAIEQIARLLRDSGIDAPAGLFDEALTLAQDGHLSPAVERLRMLLVLDPSDAEASLLLGKILATRGQFQEALTALDAAVTHGAVLTPGLRDRVEAGLRKQVAEAEDHRNRVVARERGEVQGLRAEAKKLRSENAVLELEVEELQRRLRLWSGATAVIGGVASALILALLLFGGSPEDEMPALTSTTTPTAEEVVISPSAQNIGVASVGASPVGSAPATASAEVATPPASVKPAATATAATPATKPAATTATGGGKTHTVKGGDTLGSLASTYYGKSSDWPIIQKANADQLKGGTDLKLGMKLKIPAKP